LYAIARCSLLNIPFLAFNSKCIYLNIGSKSFEQIQFGQQKFGQHKEQKSVAVQSTVDQM
jgi:hypothetical protein